MNCHTEQGRHDEAYTHRHLQAGGEVEESSLGITNSSQYVRACQAATTGQALETRQSLNTRFYYELLTDRPPLTVGNTIEKLIANYLRLTLILRDCHLSEQELVEMGTVTRNVRGVTPGGSSVISKGGCDHIFQWPFFSQGQTCYRILGSHTVYLDDYTATLDIPALEESIAASVAKVFQNGWVSDLGPEQGVYDVVQVTAPLTDGEPNKESGGSSDGGEENGISTESEGGSDLMVPEREQTASGDHEIDSSGAQDIESVPHEEQSTNTSDGALRYDDSEGEGTDSLAPDFGSAPSISEEQNTNIVSDGDEQTEETELTSTSMVSENGGHLDEKHSGNSSEVQKGDNGSHGEEQKELASTSTVSNSENEKPTQAQQGDATEGEASQSVYWEQTNDEETKNAQAHLNEEQEFEEDNGRGEDVDEAGVDSNPDNSFPEGMEDENLIDESGTQFADVSDHGSPSTPDVDKGRAEESDVSPNDGVGNSDKGKEQQGVKEDGPMDKDDGQTGQDTNFNDGTPEGIEDEKLTDSYGTDFPDVTFHGSPSAPDVNEGSTEEGNASPYDVNGSSAEGTDQHEVEEVGGRDEDVIETGEESNLDDGSTRGEEDEKPSDVSGTGIPDLGYHESPSPSDADKEEVDISPYDVADSNGKLTEHDFRMENGFGSVPMLPKVIFFASTTAIVAAFVAVVKQHYSSKRAMQAKRETSEEVTSGESGEDSDGVNTKEDKSNPFAPREGLPLIWRNVNMTLVSQKSLDCFCAVFRYTDSLSSRFALVRLARETNLVENSLKMFGERFHRSKQRPSWAPQVQERRLYFIS